MFVPTVESMVAGRVIRAKIHAHWRPPSYYFHFRPGGHLAALRAHIEDRFFYRADLSKFYNHLNLSRVTRNLKQLFPYAEAREMAVSSLVHNPESNEFDPIVPFGFPQSPIIASLCFRNSALGNYLHQLHCDHRITVSVYMDDIIVSTHDLNILSEFVQSILEKAQKSGLPMNPDKCQGPDERIEAFNIELTNQSIQLTEARLSEFTKAYSESINADVRAGILGYISSVNHDQAAIVASLG